MKIYNVLSLGGGVQSTSLALMSENKDHGIPKFDFAVFSDTAAEPQGVYEHLDRLERVMNCPIIWCIKDKGILEGLKQGIAEGKFACVPFFTESDKSRRGQLRRQCTNEYKLRPIRKAIREQIGIKKYQKVPWTKINVVVWIGISYDELDRQTEPDVRWIKHRYPLVEKRITRTDCEHYLRNQWAHPITKSACTFCPYHSNAMWQEMKDNDPVSWNQALEVDRMIRAGVRGTKQKCYLHPSLKPLEEVDFLKSTQDGSPQYSMRDECEGMCGL